MQPGLADATTGIGSPPRRRAATLRARMRRDSSGCSSAYAPPAPQHSPSSSVSTSVYAGASTVRTAPCALLHVPEVARVLHDDASHRSRRSGTSCSAQPLREVATRGAERVRLGGVEEPAVVLHRRAAARAVDDDGRVAGHRAR